MNSPQLRCACRKGYRPDVGKIVCPDCWSIVPAWLKSRTLELNATKKTRGNAGHLECIKAVIKIAMARGRD